MDTASDTIKVKDYFTFYVPNAFTPAGDGKNDLFYASGINVDPDNFNMMIFDRLGMLIFNTNKWDGNRSEGWNGTKNNMGSKNDVAMDVYVYVITVKELNGLLHEYTGRITLVR
jgi:gliding motility-associated-like protein